MPLLGAHISQRNVFANELQRFRARRKECFLLKGVRTRAEIGVCSFYILSRRDCSGVGEAVITANKVCLDVEKSIEEKSF